MAPSAQAHAPRWLKVLVIVMGAVIVTGFIVVTAETIRRMSTSGSSQSPAGGAPFAQRIALPSGAQVLSMTAVGDRLVVHVEGPDGLPTAYVIDPRTGALLGTIAFPPGAAR
ncbi:hypothetical protein SAMN02745126_00788 [Enhydrobacter aerosaccus]|uniref:Uncharacterized protein n=1 Tax=Enhydrobacter aerosaccus TaxID=225324 RepID=A0A1T4K7N0_9HYPH|nr:DUF6476 family protein [Enhydrobacter aerosaccus]SJZ38419.1 hypothetical protein SAMN02745126_00788 [Enhydrobacter aerosaccus]